jgi:hypothetical protein
MKAFILIAIIFISHPAFSQLKATVRCPVFDVDLLEGNVNKVYPRFTAGEIKEVFPCYTDEVKKTDSTACAGVFIKNQGLLFYTDRHYIEVRDNYRGKMEPAVMGATRGSLFKILGNPKIKDVSWDAFQTKYGTLIIYYNTSGKINKLQMSSLGTESIKLCN